MNSLDAIKLKQWAAYDINYILVKHSKTTYDIWHFKLVYDLQPTSK